MHAVSSGVGQNYAASIDGSATDTAREDIDGDSMRSSCIAIVSVDRYTQTAQQREVNVKSACG